MKYLIIPFVFTFVFAIAALVWWAFQSLFNVVSPIFGGPVISFWQAAAICVLGGIVGGWFRSARAQK